MLGIAAPLSERCRQGVSGVLSMGHIRVSWLFPSVVCSHALSFWPGLAVCLAEFLVHSPWSGIYSGFDMTPRVCALHFCGSYHQLPRLCSGHEHFPGVDADPPPKASREPNHGSVSSLPQTWANTAVPHPWPWSYSNALSCLQSPPLQVLVLCPPSSTSTHAVASSHPVISFPSFLLLLLPASLSSPLTFQDSLFYVSWVLLGVGRCLYWI